MKHRHFTQAARRLTALTLALLLALPSAYAAAGSPSCAPPGSWLTA